MPRSGARRSDGTIFLRRGLDRLALKRAAERATYAQKVAAAKADQAARRLARLTAAAAGIRSAVEELDRVSASLRDPEFRLRKSFVFRESAGDGSIEDRPPSGQLVFRPGRSMALELSALFAAQAGRFDRPLTDRRRGWSALIGDADPSARNRRLHLGRALEELERRGLVELGPYASTRRYDNFKLLREDGKGINRYRRPGDQAAHFKLPITFITNGWHLVLEPGEIAMYLMVQHLAGRFRREHGSTGVGAVDSVRRAHYGVTPEVYSTHEHLAVFGLLSELDSVPGRQAGRVDPSTLQDPADLVVLRFQVVPNAFDRTALEVVRNALAPT